MLVLSRRPGERIVLTIERKEVVIEVLEVSRNRVRIGIDAQKEIKVVREELPRQTVVKPWLRETA